MTREQRLELALREIVASRSDAVGMCAIARAALATESAPTEDEEEKEEPTRGPGRLDVADGFGFCAGLPVEETRACPECRVSLTPTAIHNEGCSRRANG